MARLAAQNAVRLLLAGCALGCSAPAPKQDNASAPSNQGGSSSEPGPAREDAGGLPSPSTTDAGQDAGSSAAPDATSAAADASEPPPPASEVRCAPRPVSGDPRMRFHHVHFNTVDPEADLMFFERLLGAAAVELCRDPETSAVTRATKTERGYFLYTKVATPPDDALNTYLEHVGWIHPDPNSELQRLVALNATLYPEVRFQCPEAVAGQMACGFGGYWFYLQAPSGARIEIAKGPGPATAGFGHVHMIMGVDFTWYETVTDGAYAGGAIDLVNHTAVSLTEDVLATEMVVETRGKPIDHIAYSTTDLDAARARIVAAGLELAEDVSMKPELGFRSFFVKDAKGIWVEVVEDSPFAP
jgi:predicted enzyme related to lactoylglutathione lyase